ncbi:MAG: CHAT domain-containing protein [Bacteroidetes bacterium]|nr:CHAT domain-containing protein [Bacteroidota bacterium]MCW5895017.1 CHAT domain-containing protein [Bacteroidota bacterium]
MKNRLLLFLILATTPASSPAQIWEQYVLRADSIFRSNPKDSATIVNSLLESEKEWYYITTDTGTARIFNPVGEPLWFEQPEYGVNEELIHRTMEIRVALLGRNHPHVARSLERIGMLHTRYFRLEEAGEAFAEGLRIYEATLGPNHPDLGRILHCVGFTHRYQYRFDEAEKYLSRSLQVREEGLHPDDPMISYSLNGLAHLYFNLGRYKEAEQLYKRGAVIREKAYGLYEQAAIGSRSNLVRLYMTQGRYEEAEQILHGPSGLFNRINTGSQQLMKLYLLKGQFDQAIEYATASIAQLTQQIGENSPFVGDVYCFLAQAHRTKGSLTEAEQCYLKSIEVLEDQSTTGTGLEAGLPRLLLGELYCQLSRLDEAEVLLNRVVRDRELLYGSAHPTLATALESRSRYHLLRGNTADALADAALAFDIRRRHYDGAFEVMAEHEALGVFQSLRESAGNYFSSLLKDSLADAESLRHAFDVLLSVKGRVSDGMIQRQSRLKGGVSNYQSLLDNYLSLKGRLSSLYSQGPNPASPSGYRTALDSLTLLVRDLEFELVLQSRDFRIVKSESNVTNADLLTSLPNGITLLEYFRYSKFYPENHASLDHYLVAILNTNGTIALLDLGSSDSIDQLIADYRKHFLQVSTKKQVHISDDKTYASIARSLYQSIWTPVLKHIPSGTTGVFIAPDAGLNLIAFGGLMNREGQYVIEQHPIHHLTSSREILRLREEDSSAIGLLLMGNPDYHASARKRVLTGGLRRSEENRTAFSSLTRNVRTDCSHLNQITVSPLPASEAEVLAISRSWNLMSENSLQRMYVGPEASEENFKQNATGKRVIHIATHGYFLGGECTEASNSSGTLKENPLLQSGLFLAGANLHGKDADSLGTEDGILTALEVSAMDLRGTDLVVLSACETGLGKVEQGEGVYGLRRAFQMAGAKTVVSSLWKVPDKETVQFMKALYATKAKTYPELMQQVALKRIRELRLRGRPTHPFTWGAFVVTGDWRIRGVETGR